MRPYLIQIIFCLTIIGCSSTTQQLAKEKIEQATKQIGSLASAAETMIFPQTTKQRQEQQPKSGNTNPTFVKYDHSPKVTGLPITNAKISPVKIKGFAINMTEQDFIDNLMKLEEDEGSCIINESSKDPNPYKHHSNSHCRAILSDGLLAEIYYFDGRAKKIYLNNLGSAADVRQALVKRYGKPQKTKNETGQGEPIYFNDGTVSTILHKGDFINFDIWETQGTCIVLDKSASYAVVSLYDINFSKELKNRIDTENNKRINSLLD